MSLETDGGAASQREDPWFDDGRGCPCLLAEGDGDRLDAGRCARNARTAGLMPHDREMNAPSSACRPPCCGLKASGRFFLRTQSVIARTLLVQAHGAGGIRHNLIRQGSGGRCKDVPSIANSRLDFGG